MAKADARPKAKEEKDERLTADEIEHLRREQIAQDDAAREAFKHISLGAHDAPGLSPYERMLELTRRLIHVPKAEVDEKRDRAR